MNKREENGLSENKKLKSEDLAKLSLSATVKNDYDKIIIIGFLNRYIH